VIKMSPWLKPLHLRTGIKMGTIESLKSSMFPEWASFLIWTGWWMRITRRVNTRIFMVLLMPTRACCSALCSFGALIGSMVEERDSLTWEKCLSLPVGTSIYWHEGRQKHSGTIIGKCEVEGLTGVRVKYETKGRRNREATKIIFKHHLSHDRIKLTPFLSNQSEEILETAKTFYRSVTGEVSDLWISSWTSECLLVTNRAGWKRENEGLLAAVATGDNPIALSDALMWWLKDGVHAPRVCLSSPKSVPINSHEIPLAILDGPDALRSMELVYSQNILILLDQTEYDEGVENLLAQPLSVRNDELLPFPEGVAETLPSSIEMTMFALDTGGH